MQPFFTDGEISPIAFFFSIVIFLTCFTTVVFLIAIRITLIRNVKCSVQIILHFSSFSLWMFCYVVKYLAVYSQQYFIFLHDTVTFRRSHI